MEPRKPTGRKGYGSIPHLSGSRLGPSDRRANEGHERIATVKTRDSFDLVIVQEKLDGSNCSIAKVDGEIIAITRSGIRASESRFGLHHAFDRWVKAYEVGFGLLLNEGEWLAGEWLWQAHGTRYRLPHPPFVAFDLFHEDRERLTYHEFLGRVLPFRLVVPRLIHMGGAISIAEVLKRLEPSGHGAIDPVEGAVWRVERAGRVEFLAKYVRPDKVDGKYLSEESPVLNELILSERAA